MNKKLDFALSYLRRGFSVLPLNPGSKRPVGRWAQYQYQPPGERQVRDHWHANPENNVGVITCAGATDEARRLVIFDFDNPEVLAQQRGRLPRKTCSVWSGRPGRKHIWVLAPEPIPTSHRPGLDIKGVGGYCAAPPSTHENGRNYEFESGPERIAEMSWRELEFFGVEPFARKLDRERPAWIPHTAWMILGGACGDEVQARDTRSEYEFVAVCALLGAGADSGDIYSVFLRFSHAGTKFQELRKTRGNQGAERWLMSTINAARRYMDRQWASLNHSLIQVLERLPDFCRSTQGTTELQSVYGAFIRTARRLRKSEFDVDLRTLAETAGVTPPTVSTGIRRLIQMGAVFRSRESRANFPGRYVLREAVPGFEKGSGFNIPGGGTCDVCKTRVHFDAELFLQLMGHDLFAANALGKVALRIWIMLCVAGTAGRTVAEIASELQLAEKTVRKNANRMAAASMLRRDRRVWRMRPDADLDAIAIRLGHAGIGTDRQLRHISDRVAFEARLGIDRRDHHRRCALQAQGVLVGPGK